MARTLFKLAAPLTGLIAVLLSASASFAADQPTAGTDFRVAVRGSVPVRCSLTPVAGAQTFQNPQTDANTLRAETLSLGFAFECNTGFAIRMGSTRGGLTRGDAPTISPFAEVMAYDAAITLPGFDRVLGCNSAAMVGVDSPCTQTMDEARLPEGVLTGSGQIDLRLVPDGRPLLAGRYEDFLVVTLSPLMGGAAL